MIVSDANLARAPQTPRVLIVEDEQRLRDLLVDVLPGMGYEPTGVRTAEQAFHHLDDQPDAQPHVVMLDLNLPVMHGLDFLAKLRERATHRDTPVVIMTGFGDLESAQRAIRHGVTDFLTKPCHLGEIEAALGRARHRLIELAGGSPMAESTPAATDADADEAAAMTIADLERRAILDALRRHAGNRSAAAAELGISRRTLYNKLAEYERDPDRPGEA